MYQNQPATTVPATPAPAKKRKRVFMWFFLAVQAIFLIWVITGAASGHSSPGDCTGLDAKTCQDAADAGTAIGVGLLIGLWMAVDFILGITWLVVRLARRERV